MLSVNSSSVHADMIYTHCCSLDHEEVILKAIIVYLVIITLICIFYTVLNTK